jgi:cell fate regulator YaaT (PSP1 superfamily)
MEKQLTIKIANVSGEDGLTIACKRGELFRNDDKLEHLYKQGYRVHNYSIIEGKTANAANADTLVKVFLKK